MALRLWQSPCTTPDVQPPQRTAAIPLLLILASLVAAIALPVLIQRRLTRLWTEVSDLADPARALVADVQAAMGLEMAGSRGFLITRDPAYKTVYENAHRRGEQAYAELLSLTDRVGGDSHRAAVRLGELLDAADEAVRDLYLARLSPAEYAAQLGLQQARFRQAMETAVDVDRQLRAAIASRRNAIHRAERLRLAGFVAVTLIAFGAAIAVASLGSQYRRAYEAERRARAESDHARRYAEHQRAALEKVTESRAALIRGFTHDVKNPIGAAAGDLQLLQKGAAGPLNGRQHASVSRAGRALEAALALIQDLLALARAETMEMTRTEVDVRSLAGEVVDEHQAAAGVKGLTLIVDASPDVPPVVSDPGRLRQIMGNLISNAVKYTVQGTVTVRVRLRRRGRAHRDWIAVDVADTGPGIPEPEREFLFREFHRLGSSRGTQGAGIGLAISKRLARALDGDISVDSAVGRGSVFTLWLPIDAAA